MCGALRQEAILVAQSMNGGLGATANGETGDTAMAGLTHPSDAARMPSDGILSLVLSRLEDDQAADVISIDLLGKSDVADAMVIASGRSQRHVGAIADKIARDLKEAGVKAVAIEGMPACDWVLIDGGDVIVHIFRPEVRSFYNLERIWAPELYAERSAGGYEPTTDAFEVADTAAG